MQVNDSVLTEKYVQQYIRECIAKPNIDLGSDDRILIASWYTPRTCESCRRPKQKVKTKPLYLKLLQNTKTKRALVNAVTKIIYNITT